MILGGISGNTFAVIGLLLDILGVVILAVPEFPWLTRKFKFGKLRDAMDSLDHGGLSSGDTGFNEVVSLHNDSQPNLEITPDDVSEIKYEPKVESVIENGHVVDERVVNRVEFEYAEQTEFAGLEVVSQSTLPGRIYPKMQKLVEKDERRIRLLGLVIILCGFTFQFIGVL